MSIPPQENFKTTGLAEYSLFGSLAPASTSLRDLTNQVASQKMSSLKEKPISQELVDYGIYIKKFYENRAQNRQNNENLDAYKPAKVVIGFDIKKK
ncbi:MAG: hypothetical protein FJZ60_00285 [Chlamydiae bacterium]|nr:hypothetical protein [Chlamydiota bacterium]